MAMDEQSSPVVQPRRRRPTWRTYVRIPLGIYDLAAMVFLIYYVVKWNGVLDPWNADEGETKKAADQVAMALAAATLGFTATLAVLGLDVYNAMSKRKRIEVNSAIFFVDLPIVALAVAGWCVGFLNSIWNSSYQGYPVPPDRPWIADERIASGVVIGLWIFHMLVLVTLCCMGCCCWPKSPDNPSSRPTPAYMRNQAGGAAAGQYNSTSEISSPPPAYTQVGPGATATNPAELPAKGGDA